MFERAMIFFFVCCPHGKCSSVHKIASMRSGGLWRTKFDSANCGGASPGFYYFLY